MDIRTPIPGLDDFHPGGGRAGDRQRTLPKARGKAFLGKRKAPTSELGCSSFYYLAFLDQISNCGAAVRNLTQYPGTISRVKAWTLGVDGAVKLQLFAVSVCLKGCFGSSKKVVVFRGRWRAAFVGPCCTLLLTVVWLFNLSSPDLSSKRSLHRICVWSWISALL